MSEAPAPAERKGALSVRSATFLGIGSMIGAGIFALLGEAGAVAGAAVWLSFLIGGVVATLLGYVCVKLGTRYPSSGGLITYLIEGFGRGRLVGIASWLGYIAAIVIVISMVAVSFGSYATSLFIGENASSAWNHFFITALIVLMVIVNAIGTKVVAVAQSLIVTGVLVVFSLFIWVTIRDVDWSLLSFGGYPSVSKIVASVALTFFAYLGFNVITFTVGDLKNPAHDLPRAMYQALGITTVVYVLIAIGVFGTLTVTQVIAYGETCDRRGCAAGARRRRLHDHGGRGPALDLGRDERDALRVRQPDRHAREGAALPALLRRAVPPSQFGALITAGLVLLVANLVDLSAIASVGSAVALMIFLLVGAAGWRRRKDTGSNPAIVLLAMAVTAVVLGFFAVDTWQNAPQTFVAIIAILVLAVVLDAWTRRSIARRRARDERTGQQRLGLRRGQRRERVLVDREPHEIGLELADRDDGHRDVPRAPEVAVLEHDLRDPPVLVDHDRREMAEAVAVDRLDVARAAQLDLALRHPVVADRGVRGIAAAVAVERGTGELADRNGVLDADVRLGVGRRELARLEIRELPDGLAVREPFRLDDEPSAGLVGLDQLDRHEPLDLVGLVAHDQNG
jgi:amino acid transporter